MVQLIAERFELGDFIAQGGMGAVYRGLDRQTGQTVAIKSVRPELVDAALIARFQQEGETLRTLNHPNIVKLVMAVQDGGQHYLVMEYVSGGSLADFLAKQGSLPADQTVAIALELADALARAHHMKIIHRDLKPANVLLADDGTPRLTDFGVARTAQGNLTGTGVIVGTLSYLAPEILNGESADARADIWAFGVTLFEMLTERLPFRANSPAALITSILTQPTPDLEAMRPELPVALVDLIYRMLDKDPRQRISSMRQIAAELEVLYRNDPDTERLARPRSLNVLVESSIIALSTPTAARDNLPVQTTPFVGREAEQAELAKMIADPATRLITILGPGGMGKTRLALEAASAHLQAFADGVYFVSLAPISDPEAILSVTAEAVGFQFYQNDTAPRQQILNFFREKATLVIFDNFEHVLAGVSLIADILTTARRVKMIATSRERLNLDGETLFRLEGMDFPNWETPEDAAEYSAVKLFLSSAKRVQPSFVLAAEHLQYLARICRQVQGMPLGILLAAAWVDNLTLQEISEEIAHNIDFLETEAHNVPARQRSIRSAFDYSWNLLSADEQYVFMNASVFRGGFTREAAQAVTGASLKTLVALVNKSLLRRDPNGRYDVHELLRQYGEAKLGDIPDGLSLVRDRHCDYYASFMKRMESQLKSPQQLEAFRAIEADFSNILVGWYYAVDTLNVDALDKAWQSLELMGYYKVDNREQTLAWKRAAKALYMDNPAGRRGILFGCFSVLPNFSTTSSSRYEGTPDTSAYILLRRLDAPFELAYSLLSAHSNDLLELLIHYQESLQRFEQLQDNWGMSHAHMLIGYVELELGQADAADTHFKFAANLIQALGTPFEYSEILRYQGSKYWTEGEYHKAHNCYEQGLAIKQSFNSLGVANSWLWMTLIASRQKDYLRAMDYVQRVVQANRASGQSFGKGDSSWVCGIVYFEQGRYAEAKGFFQESLGFYEESALPGRILVGLIRLSYAEAKLGHYIEPEVCFRKALALVLKRKVDVQRNEYMYQILVGLAYLIGKLGNKTRGVEIISLVQRDYTVPLYNSCFALIESGQYLYELQIELPPDEFTAAVERGKTLDMNTVVAELLAEPPMFSGE